MKTWTFTTRSKSVYRVSEDNGEWKFGAVEVPSLGYGTVYLGASEPIEPPAVWPPVIGERAVFLFPGGDPLAGTNIISTSPVESVTEVADEPEAAE